MLCHDTCYNIVFLFILVQCKHGHIYNKFSWGNIKSLWDTPRQAGLDVRQHIIDYYRCNPSLSLTHTHSLSLSTHTLQQLEDSFKMSVIADACAADNDRNSFDAKMFKESCGRCYIEKSRF